MKKLISRNPATDTPVGEVAVSSAREITERVKQAQAAKLAWKLLGAEKRAAMLRPLLTAFARKEYDIALLTTREMGTPITQARKDCASDLIYLQHFLDQGPTYLLDEITFRDASSTHKIFYEPRGVAASIVPWNFPFANFLWGVIPNLIAGNTVVFKHSEECPLTGQLLGEIMSALDLPTGVFAQIFGASEEGHLLVNQDVDLIWFTGSSATGKKLYEIAGKKFIKTVLEMGGSNPAIIFDDADVELAIEKICRSRFTNCGQVCDAIKRVIIHRSLYDTFIQKLTSKVERIIPADPELDGTELGPLAAMRQLTLLETQIQDSVRNGATVITGGRRPEQSSGAWYLPTILTNIHPTMRVWCEETFGPVLPVMLFDTEEQAIKLANDTPYGLGAVIFSNNFNRTHRIAARLDACCIDLNAGSHWEPCTPFGGFKASGMGYEHGRAGFHELCRYKIIAQA